MKVLLDNNGYFTNNYSNVGDIENAVYVDSLPEDLANYKATCWKYVDNKWVFDEVKYEEILKNIEANEKTIDSRVTDLEEQTKSLNETVDYILTEGLE